MAVREIRVLGDPVLRTPAQEVTVFDAQLRALVQDLLDTLDDDPEARAGLAAPQIGVSRRVFAFNITETGSSEHPDGGRGYLVNPSIEDLSEEIQDGEEGCLSVPGMGFPTRRAYAASAVGVDVDGKATRVRGSGILARCLQHETDHLDGILYVDRLDREYRKAAMRELRRIR